MGFCGEICGLTFIRGFECGVRLFVLVVFIGIMFVRPRNWVEDGTGMRFP